MGVDGGHKVQPWSRPTHHHTSHLPQTGRLLTLESEHYSPSNTSVKSNVLCSKSLSSKKAASARLKEFASTGWSAAAHPPHFFLCNRVREVGWPVTPPSCANCTKLPIKQGRQRVLAWNMDFWCSPTRRASDLIVFWRQFDVGGNFQILGRFQLLTCFTRKITPSISRPPVIRSIEGSWDKIRHIYTNFYCRPFLILL